MAAGDHEIELIAHLKFRIASAPAATQTGLYVRARAANMCLSDDAEAWVSDEYLPRMLAGWQAVGEKGSEISILSISLIVDLLRIGAESAT